MLVKRIGLSGQFDREAVSSKEQSRMKLFSEIECGMGGRRLERVEGGRILDVRRADIFRILKFEDLSTRIAGSQADHMPTKNHTN